MIHSTIDRLGCCHRAADSATKQPCGCLLRFRYKIVSLSPAITTVLAASPHGCQAENASTASSFASDPMVFRGMMTTLGPEMAPTPTQPADPVSRSFQTIKACNMSGYHQGGGSGHHEYDDGYAQQYHGQNQSHDDQYYSEEQQHYYDNQGQGYDDRSGRGPPPNDGYYDDGCVSPCGRGVAVLSSLANSPLQWLLQYGDRQPTSPRRRVLRWA